jgi:glycosyltransferase involved in cell wall biosynthesis
MRLAFVVQRYGLEVHGGSELHCRAWAERLAAQHHVEVLTTCARDYLTWADYYAPGVETINGVRVQRFAVDAPRDLAVFDQFSQTIFGQPHTRAQEIEWMRRQGPYASGLFQAITAQRDHFDLFIFMTYLYCTTYFGLPLVREKAALVPTAHDELPIHLGIFKELFGAPRYIMYNSPTERAMLRRLFALEDRPGSEVGVGVDLPPVLADDQEQVPPTLLYIGRIHPSKGCEQLYDAFVRYRATCAAPLRLIFAGRADVAMPEHPEVVYTGFVSEAEKQLLLRQCSILALPSAFESLSIVCLEAWAAGKPTLVNGDAAVLREQTLRSQGGLFYTSYDEFAACLDLLLADEALRRRLGQQGRAFVERWYSWPVVERRLETALAEALESVKEQ